MFRTVLYIVIVFIFTTERMQAQSSWSFVGPYSNNNLSGAEFETSQMSSIIINPNNSLHLFASSKFGGLWESTNGGSDWVNVDTKPTGLNGVIGLSFKSSTEILVGNYHPMKVPHTTVNLDYSNQVSIYNFQLQTWTHLPQLPNFGVPYVIKCVSVHPANSSIYYAGTSVGLFRFEAGVWTLIVPNCFVENMVFVPKANGVDYFCYIAGSNSNGNYSDVTGDVMFKESTDINNSVFSDLSNNFSTAGYSVGQSKLCVGSTVAGVTNLFMLTDIPAGVPSSTYPYIRKLHKININTSTGYQSNNLLISYNDNSEKDRIALVYDGHNNFVWLGGIYVGCYNLNTSVFNFSIKTSSHSLSGNTHADQHEFIIKKGSGAFVGSDTLYVANDGGISKASLNISSMPGNINFIRWNNKLNVCLINGFSGSEQNTNLYAIGGQDIVNTDIYDAFLQRNRSTYPTWENDGAFIDKFDDNFMLFDQSSYSPDYYYSLDKGYTLYPDQYYSPNSTLPFEASNSIISALGTFGYEKFKQDPYRRGRIYKLGIVQNPRLYQYDVAKNKFVLKTSFTDGSPSLCWAEAISDISFSPQTINSMHIVTNGGPLLSGDPAARVHKYIGPNIEECFSGHYEFTDSNGNPQWQNISPNYANFSSIGGGAIDVDPSDLGMISYIAVETSRWDKDLIYVASRIHLTNRNKYIKVIKHNGVSWSDYSLGIPADEIVTAMVMDHLSNDDLYLSTDKRVYFRKKGSSSWMPFDNGLPAIDSRQIEINYTENTVRVGTYGRGIFKSPLQCPSSVNLALTGNITSQVYEVSDNITANGIASMSGFPTGFRAGHSIILNPGFVASGSSTSNNYLLAYIHGCSGSSTSPELYRTSEVDKKEDIKGTIVSEVKLYPNPNNGLFTIETNIEGEAVVEIFDMNGKLCFTKKVYTSKQTITLDDILSGVYLIQITEKTKVSKHKLIVLK